MSCGGSKLLPLFCILFTTEIVRVAEVFVQACQQDLPMEDTCLFAESFCYILNHKPEFVRDLLTCLEDEVNCVTLGDLQPCFQCLPPPKAGVCPVIPFFPSGSQQAFNPLKLTKEDIARLELAGLFRLHVCRLADDAIRDREVPYEQVRDQVSEIGKQFSPDLWLADFNFWVLSLTRTSLEELQKCLADATASQTQPSLEELRKSPMEETRSEFPQMLKLPEEFLKQVFEACKNLEEKIDPFHVREMLDKCGRYYREQPQEELRQLHEEAEREAEKGEEEDRDFNYWNHVYAFSCPKPDLTESEAQELAEHIYDVCKDLGIDSYVLIGQG